LHTGRAYHTATLLSNGKVLVAGGYVQRQRLLASAELYDPASRAWTTTGSLNNRAWLSHGDIAVQWQGPGRRGYNYTGSDVVATAELYDPASGTWTTTGSLTLYVGRDCHTATLLANGKVLIAGVITAKPARSYTIRQRQVDNDRLAERWAILSHSDAAVQWQGPGHGGTHGSFI